MTCSRWRSVKSTSVRNIDDLSIPSVASSRSARLNVPSKRSVASSTSIRTAVGRMPWRSSTSSQCFVSIGSALRSRRPETVRCAGSNFTIGEFRETESPFRANGRKHVRPDRPGDGHPRAGGARNPTAGRAGSVTKGVRRSAATGRSACISAGSGHAARAGGRSVTTQRTHFPASSDAER